MDPLISVTIPTYNAASTLPLALASVVAQTYQHWECIIVDDGSTDATEDLMRVVQEFEPRIHYIRLDKNCGRAVARQIALDHSQGQYLAMVDADDWIYPFKLEQQVQIMQTYPEIAVVSTGMVIVDSGNNLLGVRRVYEGDFIIHPPLKRPQSLPIAHAPSMIRVEVAKTAGYDPSFRRTEDAEFLLRILLEHSYAIMGEPLYAYSEYHSLHWQDIITSQASGIRLFNKYWSIFPLTTLWNITMICGKMFATTMINLLGQAGQYSRLRPIMLPTSTCEREFHNARHIVFTQAVELNL